MSMKEDVLDMKKEVEEIKTQSLAMELLHQSKKTNQRIFIVWLITFVAFIGLLGYTIYLLNDIGVEETTTETTTTAQEIEDVGSIDNSYIINGDNYGKDKNN